MKPKEYVSNCCNYNVIVSSGEEGTNCYICGKCTLPCDVIGKPKELKAKPLIIKNGIASGGNYEVNQKSLDKGKGIKTIYYTKKVFLKGFQIGNVKPGTSQDDCNGKCVWKSMGIKNWHRCKNCGTEELIKL